MIKMQNTIDDEIMEHTCILYLFEPNRLLEHYKKTNYDKISFLIIFTIMKEFIETTYYPSKYRDALQMTLLDIREMTDKKADGSSEAINEFITELNLNKDVKSTKTYVEEIVERDISKIKKDTEIDLIIKQYIHDISIDLDIFNTHSIEDYFVKHVNSAKEMNKDIGYYKVIKYLLNKYSHLKTNEVFINNVDEAMKYATTRKVKKYIKKEFKKTYK